VALAGIFDQLAHLARLEILVARLRRSLLARQAWRFVLVNTCCTVLTIMLYVALQTWLRQDLASVLAYAVTTVVSSTANRLITFGHSRMSLLRFHTQSVLTFLFYCTSSTIALDLLGVVVTHPTPTEQVAAVCAVSVLGGTGRFFLLRGWVFRIRTVRRDSVPSPGDRQVCPGGASH
jgi:putative flippase GtrA